MTSQNLVAGNHLVDVNLVAEDDHVVVVAAAAAVAVAVAVAVENVKYSPVVGGSDNIHDLEKVGVDVTSVMVAFACAFGSVTMKLPGLTAVNLV